MAAKLIRKVQLMGGSTYVVSLPKDWAIKHGISRGSAVELRLLPDGSLKLVPATGKKRVEAVVEAGEGVTESMLVREVTLRYLAGYKIIRVRLGDAGDYSLAEAVKEAVEKKLIGAEILSESGGEMVIRILVNTEELPVDEIIRQMSRVAAGMLEECAQRFGRCDVGVDFRDIISRDDLVDKLYLYGLRQLYSILRGYTYPEAVGLRGGSDILPYACAMSDIERVADNAAMIAYNCGRLKRGGGEVCGARSIADLAEEVVLLFKKSVEVFLRRDKAEAYRLLETLPGLIEEREEKILSDLGRLPPGEALGLKLILLSYRSVVDYSRDMLETVPRLVFGAETI